ncbi:MAG: aquaporin [Candidatus Neomarinimicrobiota bacterium]|tara:strand:- start:118 stop:759 length:642 start_codon:yes stop_codon:yes gene_type:complete
MKTKLISETVGTLFLLLIVVGSGIMGENLTENKAVVLLANSIATAFGLIVLIWTFGPYSGAHFNPVVSIVMMLLGKLTKQDMLFYVLCQLIGGVLGVIFANMIFDLDIISISDNKRLTSGIFVSEIIATFGLLITILLVSKQKTEMVAPAVGLYIGAAYWFTSSTSFSNPAVTIARTLSNTFTGIIPSDVIPFIFAQLIGTLIVYFIYKHVYE